MTKPNFIEVDLTNEIQGFYARNGLRFTNKGSFDSILINYLSIRFKLIQQKNRIVLNSSLIEHDLINHSKKSVIQYIFNQLICGNNINQFLSKKSIQSRFHDHLANRWNVFHFHLSTSKDKKTHFVKQVNDLIFIYITDSHAILLGTDRHNIGVFANSKWLEILHDEFPYLIQQFEAGWDDVNPKVNAEERQELWNKGYTLGLTKIREKVYFNPNGVSSTSGHSSDVTRTANKIHRWIHYNQPKFETKHDLICFKLGLNPREALFRLRMNDTIEIYEELSDTHLFNFPDVIDI